MSPFTREQILELLQSNTSLAGIDLGGAPSELVVTIIMKLPTPLMTFLYRLAHFIMDQRHLVGIKQRAEHQVLEGAIS